MSVKQKEVRYDSSMRRRKLNEEEELTGWEGLLTGGPSKRADGLVGLLAAGRDLTCPDTDCRPRLACQQIITTFSLRPQLIF